MAMMNTDPQADLRAFVEKASRRAEKIFRKTGELHPMWHGVALSGEEMLLPQLSEDRDLNIAMVKAIFAAAPARRYVFIGEAWTAPPGGESDLSVHPQRQEVVLFTAEDCQLGSMAAVRKIVRQPGKRPRLEPLEFMDPVQGRLAGLLPRIGKMQ
jgi:hypothetical protein